MRAIRIGALLALALVLGLAPAPSFAQGAVINSVLLNAARRVTLPGGLGWDSARFPINAFKIGATYRVLNDPKSYVPCPLTATATNYYADVATGNNTRTGLSPAASVRDISKAVTLGDATGACFRVNINASGLYTLTNGFMSGAQNIFPTQDVAFVGYGGTPVICVCSNLTWTDDGSSTHTYQATLSNPSRVVELDVLDAQGVPLDDTKLTTKAAVEGASGGAWALVTGVLYEHRSDNAAVTNTNTRAFLTAKNLFLDATTKSVYIENLDLQGGEVASLQATGIAARNIACLNATFEMSGSTVTGGLDVAVNGLNGLFSAFNCVARGSANDGFDFHLNNGGTGPTYILTVGVHGYDNGRFTWVSNNCWTAHDAVIGVNFNSECDHDYGPEVHNIGTSRFANYGMFAHDSHGDLGMGGSYPSTGVKTSDSAFEWHFDLTLSANSTAISALNTSTICTRNLKSDGGTQSKDAGATIGTC